MQKPANLADGPQPGEFRQHWRPLAAAFLGVGSSLSLNSYILSIFAPYLIEEFGWSRSQWALMGVAQMLMMVTLPFAGRLADVYGVRKVASIGVFSFPVFLLLITVMDGSISTYLAIYVAQLILGSVTTTTVFSRVVAQAFDLRRGLALGLCGIGPPLIGAMGSPLLTAFVQQHGWRAGYLAVAAFCLIAGVVALALVPPHVAAPRAPAQASRRAGVFGEILRMPAFWILFIACFLANLPFSMATAQLKMVLIDQGLSDAMAAWLISAFALGSIAGRVLSGLALDRMPAWLVGFICFFLPFVGLVLLALPWNAVALVATAVLLVGLSFGGEGDIIPYLVTRYFGIEVYSTVLGMLTAAMGAAMGVGNAILGVVLKQTDSFQGYFLIAGAGAFIGSAMFILLASPRFRAMGDAASTRAVAAASAH